MRRLVLHAGTHKTGTTSIQKVLSKNRDWLRDRGVFYPGAGATRFLTTTEAHHTFAHAMAGTDPDAKARALDWVAEVHDAARPGETVVISAEATYRHIIGDDSGDIRWDYSSLDYWPRREAYLERLAEALSPFAVEVVLFFRTPDGFARSLFGSKERRRWYADLATLQRSIAPLLDYERQLDALRATFPRVCTASYEDSLPAGTVPAFFRLTDLTMPPGAERVWARVRSASMARLRDAASR